MDKKYKIEVFGSAKALFNTLLTPLGFKVANHARMNVSLDRTIYKVFTTLSWREDIVHAQKKTVYISTCLRLTHNNLMSISFKRKMVF